MQSVEYLFATYSIFFFSAALFALLINSIFLTFAKTLGIRNRDEGVIRWNAAKPALGGISFFIVFLVSVVSYSIFFDTDGSFPDYQALGMLGSTVMAFLMGLADDAYDTKPLLKFSVQVGCGALLISTGIYIQLFDTELLNYALTILWVVGIMNSINMLDNMDGITSITSAGIIIVAIVAILISGDYKNVDLIICIGVVASLVGFLFHNWHPSKLYMGDTGSQFLGIFLAIIGIKYLWNFETVDGNSEGSRQLILVFIAFALPIIDTTTVVINRLSRKQSPFVGGKDHTTHHLSYLGLSDSQVGLIFLGISAVSGFLCFVIFNFIEEWTHTHTLIFAAYFLILFAVLFGITKMKKTKD
jgi:UDP-GlcNAc:undecaprenyl-phosphate GlcNAc-1-phosphate transferase